MTGSFAEIVLVAVLYLVMQIAAFHLVAAWLGFGLFTLP